jgi:rubrerythrin
MRITDVLSRLETVESTMAEFYEWLSEVFEADADASGLFFRMSLQEKSHASLLKYGRKLVNRNPEDFEDVEFDGASVDALLASVDSFRHDSQQPSLADALFFAMKIECHPAENAHREVLAVSNPEIGQIIRTLAIADDEHHRTLQAFAQTRAALFD